MSYIAQLFQNRHDVVFNKQGQFVDLKSHCKGKSVGLLFSGYWCKPCREMCPDIIKYYQNHKGGKEFEIIYISGDTDEAAFQKYYGKMPWLALDFNEQYINMDLMTRYKISQLPHLVVLDADTGKVKIEDALEMFEEDLVEKQESENGEKKKKKKIKKVSL